MFYSALRPSEVTLDRFYLLLNYIKINVDKSFLTESNMSEMDSVFLDHLGNFILHFSKEIRLDYAILTEVMTIKYDLLITVASRWTSLTTFYIELDFTNTISWFKNNS